MSRTKRKQRSLPGKDKMRIPKILAIMALTLGITFLSGCLIPPYWYEKTPEISGLVLDADSKKPIQDAILCFVSGETPIDSYRVQTDDSGHFRMKKTREFAMGFLINVHGDWNPVIGGNGYSNTLRVSHVNYYEKTINIYELVQEGAEIGTILLKKKEPDQSP